MWPDAQGLQMVEKDTYKVVLLTGHVPSANLSAPPDLIRYANDLDIAPNSTIYFTDSQRIGPILNKQGYFDTLNAYIAGALQVRLCLPDSHFDNCSCRAG